MLRLAATAMLLATLAVAKEPDKTVTFTRAYGPGALPAFDKGYLLFINRPNSIEVWGPDGRRMFSTAVTQPSGASVMTVAVDNNGIVATGFAYPGIAQSGYAGGIALFDVSGKQIRFVDTGRFMPSHICFDANHNLWTFGWQRDAIGDTEDTEDYAMFRKFSPDGKLAGSFVLRSLFPGKGVPGDAFGGLWRLRLSEDRINAIAYSGKGGHEWIELGLDGSLLGHWKIGPEPNGGTGLVSSAGLCRQRHEKDSHNIDCFDRQSQTWKTRSDLTVVDDNGRTLGILLGGEGNHLVFGISDGLLRLSWLPVPPK